jgi:hypothetical protein
MRKSLTVVSISLLLLANPINQPKAGSASDGDDDPICDIRDAPCKPWCYPWFCPDSAKTSRAHS